MLVFENALREEVGVVDLDGGGASHVLAEVQRGDLHQKRVTAGRVMEPVAVARGGVAFGSEYVGEQGGQVPVIGTAVVIVDAELGAEAGVGVKRGVSWGSLAWVNPRGCPAWRQLGGVFHALVRRLLSR